MVCALLAILLNKLYEGLKKKKKEACSNSEFSFFQLVTLIALLPWSWPVNQYFCFLFVYLILYDYTLLPMLFLIVDETMDYMYWLRAGRPFGFCLIHEM